MDVESFSPPARIAEPDDGISVDELRMATRNHGMPLEMLDHDVTPVGWNRQAMANNHVQRVTVVVR